MAAKKMTIKELKLFIEKDIKKLKRERAEIPQKTATFANDTLKTYLAARQNTLMEILNYLPEK